MWKLILLALIIWLGFYIFKRNLSNSKAPKTDENMASNDAIEDMVQCATCAVHLPRSEAFLVGGIFYCSQSHIKRK